MSEKARNENEERSPDDRLLLDPSARWNACIPHDDVDGLQSGERAETEVYWSGRLRKLIKAPCPPIPYLDHDR